MRSSPSPITLQDEIHLKVLRLLDANPALSQRELAESLGVSLGKTNYCVQALLEKGFLKARNFHQQKNKRAYTYLLTPEGVAAKASLTARFLKRKMAEYDLLRAEIETLSAEIARARPANGNG
jgi:MarR family transcriptional regulator, temperature-dependent positive regulator of motility